MGEKSIPFLVSGVAGGVGLVLGLVLVNFYRNELMYCLTKKQHEVFESNYRELAPDNPWRLIELFSRNGRSHMVLHDYFPSIFARIFKIKKDNTRRLDVAAHEAGHAVTMAACHYKIGSAWIDGKNPNGTKYGARALGLVVSGDGVEKEDDNTIEPVNSMVPMPLAVLEIMATCSGFVGESFLSDHWEHSSYHERFLAYAQCRFLDDQAGSEPMTHWTLYIGAAREIIKMNSRLFWDTVNDLLENTILSDACKHRLNTTAIKPPVGLFFEPIDISKSSSSEWRHPGEEVAA